MTAIAPRLLAWYDDHGRKDLPWQQPRAAYRVWVSEIMLQQTQVQTVLRYYAPFIDRFPDVETLAQADLDDVLSCWTGLGYYRRARNLHSAAVKIQQEFGGHFPQEMDQLIALPGIGRSTAGAILALSFNKREAILDGNVKRVLSRHSDIAGWPGKSAVLKKLWRAAELNTPDSRVDDYTQAIMDLGATVCTRTQPLCAACPLESDCGARKLGVIDQRPERAPPKVKPKRSTNMLLLRHQDQIMLERRPPTGVWPGLWSFPEWDGTGSLDEHLQKQYDCSLIQQQTLEPIKHLFTHYELNIRPLLCEVTHLRAEIMDGNALLWYNSALPLTLGTSQPVQRLYQLVCGELR